MAGSQFLYFSTTMHRNDLIDSLPNPGVFEDGCGNLCSSIHGSTDMMF